MAQTLYGQCQSTDVDAVEEIRLRTWARMNYAPASERNNSWHPIVLEEMQQRDQERTRRPR